MKNRRVRIATRKSKLALAQMRAWAKTLAACHPGVQIEEVHVVTTGDKIQDRSLAKIGGKGLFIKEIEEALLDDRADLAVHSMKDVPAELAPGLTIGCVPPREDPRDVLITTDGSRFADLPSGATIGTSSLRRGVQLRSIRPELAVAPLRGNVDTRLRKLRDGEADAIVLARAGLVRLGMAAEATEILESDVCLPAIGQGALAIEHRSEDVAMAELLAPLQDAPTLATTAAERGVMFAVEGNCQVPVAAYAERVGAELRLRALLADEEGTDIRRVDRRTPWTDDPEVARSFGLEVGATLKRAP